MAEYIPGTSVTRSAAITALRHAPAPDDSDVDARNSIMNVDYLSHEWQEEADVWASWRHTTRHKNDIANGVRLENASWRTWWKQRNNLKTVSPETLNWLKDSDVTWLYGPLHTAADPVPPTKVATTEERLDLVKAAGKKPILKHRSISELLSIPRGSSPSLEAAQLDSVPEGSDLERPVISHTKSESYITKTGIRRVSPPLPELAHAPDVILGEDATDSPRLGSDTDSLTSGNAKRHISFNTFVEQCIAIDNPPRNAIFDTRTPWRVGFGAVSHGYDDDEDGVVEEDDDEGTMLTMRSTSSSGHSSPASSRRPSSSNSRSNSHSSERVTIQAIAPTLLKTQYDTVPGESPAVVYVPPLGSPYSEDPAIGSTHVGHQPLPSEHNEGDAAAHAKSQPPRAVPTHSQWIANDEDRGIGFDYFAGPNARSTEEFETARAGSSSNTSLSGSSGPAVSIVNNTASATLLRSPPSSPKTTKMPGKSILKTSFPDAAVADALRESSNKSDTYFSQNPNSIPPPPSSSAITPVPLNDKISSILATPPAPETPSPGSSDPPSLFPNMPTRGRSAIRIPGSAIGIADRERSASSKGSSPIGSVSPTSRPISGSGTGPGRSSIVKVGASRMGSGRSAVSPPVAGAMHSPSRSTVSSNSSDASSPARAATATTSPWNNAEISFATPRREDGFQPAKSNPVRSPASKKRSSMDGVPVLPTQSQLAPAQLSPGGDPPSAGALRAPAVPVLPPVHVQASLPRMPVRVNSLDSDDEGAPDGTDEYAYHSTNPTPVNSPTNSLKLLPTSTNNSNMLLDVARGGASRSNTSSGKIREATPTASIGLDAPSSTTIEEDEARDTRDDGTLVSRAVEIVTSARGLIGAIWNAGIGHSASSSDPQPAMQVRRAPEG